MQRRKATYDASAPASAPSTASRGRGRGGSHSELQSYRRFANNRVYNAHHFFVLVSANMSVSSGATPTVDADRAGRVPQPAGYGRGGHVPTPAAASAAHIGGPARECDGPNDGSAWCQSRSSRRDSSAFSMQASCRQPSPAAAAAMTAASTEPSMSGFWTTLFEMLRNHDYNNGDCQYFIAFSSNTSRPTRPTGTTRCPQ